MKYGRADDAIGREISMIKAYPRTHYEEFKKYGYRLMLFEDVITHQVEYHYHDYYEVSIILGCRNVVYYCNQKEYHIKEGDIVFTNVFEPHCYKENGPEAYCERFNIGIEFMRLMQFSVNDANLLSMFQSANTVYPVAELTFRNLLKYNELVNIYKQGEMTYARELLQNGLIQLFLAYVYEDIAGCIIEEPKNTESMQTVASIIKYVQLHLNENISLSELSQETHYSVSYICSVFRSVMNKTINNYIKEKRLEMAIQYMKTDMNITEVAEKVGFNNYSYFYKSFKNVYGINPVEYRKRHAAEYKLA